jgi:hypothetical protein
MNFVKATRRYEEWLADRTVIVKKDLRLKHSNMKVAVFPFLRATYYRWAQLWPEVCPNVANAPRVLAVGDLHLENFGTWRDIESRLIWGAISDGRPTATVYVPFCPIRLAFAILVGLAVASGANFFDPFEKHIRPFVKSRLVNILRACSTQSLHLLLIHHVEARCAEDRFHCFTIQTR